ncbi:NepR family anti-sigma factor [Methylocystis sp. B8]|uniref:NepR family anti-sigma factor n=1 Tax=Methylocystis sp. B8 TaxID=544938 RepID=UPI0014853DED|nr:NepR family anti-sigma factor [Methylocystis sp. B8]
MRQNQLACEALDLERSVMRLGEQLRRQFSDVTSEPLPEDMRVLLEELSQAAE